MAEYQRMGTPERFWAKWSNSNGMKYSTSRILDGLKEERRISDDDLAAQARENYIGEDFNRQFGYWKNGKYRVCETNTVIASRYRKLKGLPL